MEARFVRSSAEAALNKGELDYDYAAARYSAGERWAAHIVFALFGQHLDVDTRASVACNAYSSSHIMGTY